MKATREFHERFQNMKLYKEGDTYSYENEDRVAYLVKEGYLEEPKKVTKKKSGD